MYLNGNYILNNFVVSCIFLVSDIRTANIEKKTAAHGRLWNTFSILVVVLQIFMHVLLTVCANSNFNLSICLNYDRNC